MPATLLPGYTWTALLTGLAAGAVRATLALAFFVVSATLVAVTVTVCAEETDEGAVYKPEGDRVPTFGLMAQVTALFDALDTAAVNCCVCDGASVTLPGATLIETGALMVTWADPAPKPLPEAVSVAVPGARPW